MSTLTGEIVDKLVYQLESEKSIVSFLKEAMHIAIMNLHAKRYEEAKFLLEKALRDSED